MLQIVAQLGFFRLENLKKAAPLLNGIKSCCHIMRKQIGIKCIEKKFISPKICRPRSWATDHAKNKNVIIKVAQTIEKISEIKYKYSSFELKGVREICTIVHKAFVRHNGNVYKVCISRHKFCPWYKNCQVVLFIVF